MSTRILCLVSLAAASLVTGCASKPAAQDGAPTAAAARPAPHAVNTMEYRTGSYIAVPSSKAKAGASPSETITRDALDQSGRTDLRSAMGTMSPSVTSSGR